MASRSTALMAWRTLWTTAPSSWRTQTTIRPNSSKPPIDRKLTLASGLLLGMSCDLQMAHVPEK